MDIEWDALILECSKWLFVELFRLLSELVKLEEKSGAVLFGLSSESSLMLEHRLQKDEELDDGTSKQLSVSTGLVWQSGLAIRVRSNGRL